jgi:rare lipoprotein A
MLVASALAAIASGASFGSVSAHASDDQTRFDGKQSRHHLARPNEAAAWHHNLHQRRGVRMKLFASAAISGRPVKLSEQSDFSGIASVYSDRETASGERMNPAAMTAAHRTLPFGTDVNVINHDNGRSAVVRINDRGPFVQGRVIDLSPAAALALGVDGLASVSLTVGGVENALLPSPTNLQDGITPQ